jgi:cellulose synthase/poly-beta-1,6-N-acetylglucosamine synthase-like glycosyltransferase
MIGICAYNEERNIGSLLESLTTKQELPSAYRVAVICSGCTDGTEDIVKKYRTEDARIEPTIEKTRMGKANALNKLFEKARRSADILVLVNADALPKRGSIRKLVSKLARSEAAGAFAQPVPFENRDEGGNVCKGIVNLIWRLHHLISAFNKPKLSGELCAIKTAYLRNIPENVATDEPYIEMTLREQNSEILYVPEASVNIRGPTSIKDLIKQRKRIWAGHLQLRNETGFAVSTMSPQNVFRMISELRPIELLYLALGFVVETVAYLEARIDVDKGEIPFVWEPILSTKT